jgi:hypothetical protein
MESIRQQLEDLACEIDGDVQHGECFYDSKMLVEFMHNLDQMKRLAKKYYHQNKAEMEESE